jgi:hypothetical protein
VRKPDSKKSRFAMLQHVYIFKIQTCERFHTPISAEFWQVEIFTRHFLLNIDRFTGSPVIFPGILAFKKVFTVFFAEIRHRGFSVRLVN